MSGNPSMPHDMQERLKRLERELTAARTISQTLFQHVHVDDLVEQALRTALNIVDAQAGSVLLADSESKTLVFHCIIGESHIPQGTAFPWDKGIAGTVFQGGEPVVTGDVREGQGYFPDIDKMTGYTTNDLIALPLKRWDGDPIGVLEVLNKRKGVLNQDDVSILTIISALTAISIEQAKLFEEARLAEVTRLLGDIGHDVKNLLMPVLCGASLLKTEVDEFFGPLPTIDLAKAKASHEMCLEVITMLENNAKRIQDRVMEIANCVKGLTSPPKFAACQISKVAHEVIEVLRLPAQEKGVQLLCEGLDELPEVEADERRLFNAFYNLAHNALGAMTQSGSIMIQGQYEPSEETVRILFIDTGPGMPPEIRDSLFSTKTVSSKAGGTGLGTKIVKDVVVAHRGTITVKSDLGIGSTFTIQLPLRQHNSSPRP